MTNLAKILREKKTRALKTGNQNYSKTPAKFFHFPAQFDRLNKFLTKSKDEHLKKFFRISAECKLYIESEEFGGIREK